MIFLPCCTCKYNYMHYAHTQCTYMDMPSMRSHAHLQKLNPLKMLCLHGHAMKIHVDAAMAAAGDAPSTMSVAMSGYEVERSNPKLCRP